MPLTKEQAKEIVVEILNKAHSRFKQESLAETEEILDRSARQYRAKVARSSWKISQKWCKFADDGPVLMPDYTRMYYRKGTTEVLAMELPPQIRLMKWHGSLLRENSTSNTPNDPDLKRVFQYTLALPYVVFLFKYTNGLFAEVKCAFSDRPLKKLEEKPYRPYLSNLDSNLGVCLGQSFPKDDLIPGNIVQQAALVLSHFWQSVYSDEWSAHFWANKGHFQSSDPRLATMEAWQAASTDNPLFVVEDVAWLPHTEDNFGDMIVRMFEDDKTNHDLQEELYKDLADGFMQDVSKACKESADATEAKVVDKDADALADLLVEKVLEQISELK